MLDIAFMERWNLLGIIMPEKTFQIILLFLWPFSELILPFFVRRKPINKRVRGDFEL